MKGKKARSSGRIADLTMAERTEVEQISRNRVAGTGQPYSGIAERIGTDGSWKNCLRLRGTAGTLRATRMPTGVGQSGRKPLSHPVGYNPKRNLAHYCWTIRFVTADGGALFVIKAGAATGWQGRGFTKDGDDTIKSYLRSTSRSGCRSSSRMPFSGTSSDIDSTIVAQFGAGWQVTGGLVLPLGTEGKRCGP